MTKIKGSGAFIDPAIDDPRLRWFAWKVHLFVFADQPHLALVEKWKRVSYIQKG
jgi:hypothetical protein